MNRFSSDRFYLLKYESTAVAVLALLLVAALEFTDYAHTRSAAFLWYLFPLFLVSFFHTGVSLVGGAAFLLVALWSGEFSLSAPDGLVVLAAIVLGGKSAEWMHNAAHRNFRWPWLSTFMGELCAMQQMVGYREWQISHFVHHKYPDDPAFDPHPPLHSRFLPYMLRMKFGIAMKFGDYYFARFARNRENRMIWAVTGLLMLISGFAKALLWYVLLGPTYFVLFLVVSNAITYLVYAHFNYSTHRPSKTRPGAFDILDLTQGWYRVLNWCLGGGYYHGTHHDKPRLYNPGLSHD